MARADLALASYGVTCLELAQMGVPTLALTLGLADQNRASRVADLGFLEVVGSVGQVEPVSVAASVDDLLGSPDTLRSMSEAGRRHIDGRGAERITAELRLLLEQ
jgi:spore coat polysaccharide biosynthesis predicted glycosyltransferase SpsG